MKHSLISCFVSNPDKRKNIENVVATTGPAPANAVGNAVGNAVKYTHNAVYAARPQTGPMPGKNHPGAKSNQLPELVFAGNQLDSVSHPHAKVVLAEQQRPARKSSQFTLCDSSCSSTTLNQNDLCLHPKNLESLLVSFTSRDEQDAKEHFANVVEIVSTWPLRWQCQGWPIVAQYCLRNLSCDDLPGACQQLIRVSKPLSPAAREAVLKRIIGRAKYASEAAHGKILLTLCEAKGFQGIESRNVLMYELIQNFHIDKLDVDRLLPVSSALLDLAAHLCQDIQEHVARNISHIIELLPLDDRIGIMIRLMKKSRSQSEESRAYLLEQLSWEIYRLPRNRIVPALGVMLAQLASLPAHKQRPVLDELFNQTSSRQFGDATPQVTALLNNHTNNRMMKLTTAIGMNLYQV